MEQIKVAILGGAGFVGSRLGDRLVNKDIVFKKYDIETKNDVNISSLDIEKVETLNQLEGADTIINLAAVHRDDIRPLSRYDDVNVQGSVMFAKQRASMISIKLFLPALLQFTALHQLIRMNLGEPNYFNDYGRTKYLAEQVYKEWQAEDPENRTLVIVRPTVIFGEGNRGNVFNLVKANCFRKVCDVW